MTIQEKQARFVLMVRDLITFAYDNGYELSFGEATVSVARCHGCGMKISKHIDNSLHYLRLAIDLNLFKDGEYLRTTEDHRPLGEYWEILGGSWGGRFEESELGKGDGKDGNHYSLEHDGMK